MAEKNDNLQKELGETPGKMAIKGTISTPDTRRPDPTERTNKADETPEELARRAPKLPPKHVFRPK